LAAGIKDATADIGIVRKKNIFRWNLWNLEVKLIVINLRYAGISFRKTNEVLADFEKFSHESVRR